MHAPSGTAAAWASVTVAGRWATTPCSRTRTYSAFAPERIPNTSSPTRNRVTASPTASTTPENSMPAIRCRGRRRPVKARVNP